MVVFRKPKRGTAPTPRAINLRPAAHGEEYGYEVEKYWRVMAVLPDGKLEVITRRGKKHTIDASDTRLRRANLFERWFLASRFPPANAVQSQNQSS
ncbi:MAG: hypothetical protein JNL67_04050 [Planctomycetaceae bacterium]|nr:hypothetical protein [Planctomycetaceae bacterium]